MGRPTDHAPFDEATRTCGKLLAQALAEGEASDSNDLFEIEAAMLDRLLGAEIAALFAEQL